MFKCIFVYFSLSLFTFVFLLSLSLLVSITCFLLFFLPSIILFLSNTCCFFSLYISISSADLVELLSSFFNVQPTKISWAVFSFSLCLLCNSIHSRHYHKMLHMIFPWLCQKSHSHSTQRALCGLCFSQGLLAVKVKWHNRVALHSDYIVPSSIFVSIYLDQRSLQCSSFIRFWSILSPY